MAFDDIEERLKRVRAASGDHESGGPLTGLRVVDCSTIFMGPYCATLLAQWGADVVKVEAPGGDVLRMVGDDAATGIGPIFLNANLGKRAVQVDLKHPEGQEFLHRLVGTADVLIHNFRAAAARRVGLTVDQLHQVNPRLVHCTFRGYGAGGSDADKPAYDDVIQAASGLAFLQGGPHDRPDYVRTAAADKVVGIYGVGAVLAALHERSMTGVGSAIEIPMLETMVSFMLLEQQGDWIYDPPRGPAGYKRTQSPHRRPYRTRDGYLAVMLYTDDQWRTFFDLIGQPDRATVPEYRSIRDRTKNSDALYALVDEHVAKRTTAEWETDLAAADLPHARVNSIEDLFDDPHLQSVGFFHTVDDPTLGRLRLAGSPVAMPEATPAPRRAPFLGEHNVEIAKELGYDAAAVRRLIHSGALLPKRATDDLEETAELDTTRRHRPHNDPRIGRDEG